MESQPKEIKESIGWNPRRKIGGKTFRTSTNYKYLCIEVGEQEIQLMCVYTDRDKNCFYVSGDKKFLVIKDMQDRFVLYSQWDGKPGLQQFMPLRKPYDTRSQPPKNVYVTFKCAVFKENGIDRYRVDWPEAEGGEVYYRPL